MSKEIEKVKFVPRLTIPEKGNPYYNRKQSGGYSTAIKGNNTVEGLDVLRNCVGYSFGRFNEEVNDTTMSLLQPVSAEKFVEVAKKQGLEVGTEPKPGAIICWSKGSATTTQDGSGHVANVEEVISPTCIKTSESGWSASKDWWIKTRYKGSDGNWGQNSNYHFLGFIYNPYLIEEGKDPYPYPKRTLYEGCTGPDVQWLQYNLKELGYYIGDIDGYLGTVTLGALLCFQFKNDLEVDGRCGKMTREKIKEVVDSLASK